MRLGWLLVVPLLAACGNHAAAETTAPPHVQPAVVQPSAGPAGSAAHDGDLTISVQTVRLTDRATYPGGIPDPDYPQNGGFVVADVIEQNNGVAMATAGGFAVSDSDGRQYPAVVEPAFDPQIVQSGQGPLQPGGKIRGNVVFDTPAKHGTIVYTTDGNVPVYSWTF